MASPYQTSHAVLEDSGEPKQYRRRLLSNMQRRMFLRSREEAAYSPFTPEGRICKVETLSCPGQRCCHRLARGICPGKVWGLLFSMVVAAPLRPTETPESIDRFRPSLYWTDIVSYIVTDKPGSEIAVNPGII